MFRCSRTALFVVCALVAAAPLLAQQSPDPNSPRYKGVVALGEFLNSEGDEALEAFIANRIAASVRESMDDAKLAETLAAMRVEAAGAEMRGGRPISELSAEIVFNTNAGELAISFELDAADNDRFTMIRSPGHSIG